MTGRTDAPWSPAPDAEAGLSTRFGENVRLLRARIHVSQEELVFRADVHRTQISLIESGQRNPRLATALKLAAALEVEVSTLLDGIIYRPRFFSAARGEFEISPAGLFDGAVGPEAEPTNGMGR
jgi:transcriptional regulator with XRE-family HTH domain